MSLVERLALSVLRTLDPERAHGLALAALLFAPSLFLGAVTPKEVAEQVA